MKRHACSTIAVSFLLVMLFTSLASAAPVVLIGGGPYDIDATGVNGDGVEITDQLYIMDCTVNYLPGAVIVPNDAPGELVDLGNCTMNVTGGSIPGEFQVAPTSVTTIKGANFTIDGLPLDDPANASIVEIDPNDPSAVVIINPINDTFRFTLAGDYDDGSPCTFSMALLTGARLNLNAAVLKPAIQVYPALYEHDFGDVEVGVEQTYVVQIFNFGNGDLVVDSISLDGAADYEITSEFILDPNAFPLVIAPSDTLGVDIEVTFTPSAEGYTSTVMTIVSNDEEEPVIDVALGGVGIVLEIPPAEQIQNILDYLDNAVEEGTIVGYGPGRCNKPEKRLKALRHMIKGAGSLIDAGYDQWAVCVLKAVDRKTDGENRPPDFVIGDGVPMLNQMVNDLINDLSS